MGRRAGEVPLVWVLIVKSAWRVWLDWCVQCWAVRAHFGTMIPVSAIEFRSQITVLGNKLSGYGG